MKKSVKILLIVVAIAVVVVSVTVPCVYVFAYSVPKVYKEDRVSRGIVPTSAQLATSPKYDRVVILGVDGAGGEFANANTPNFDRIFANGNVNFNGVSQYPTISAQNCGAMLLGVTAQSHQLTNEKAKYFPNASLEYNSIFKIYSKRHADATFFSAVNWAPINYGIIENGISGMTKINAESKAENKNDSFSVDKKVAELVVERLTTHDDKIVFTHFDSVDHAGHTHGRTSIEYREALEKIDEYIGMIYDAYEAKGLVSTTLFIVVSDHGHADSGGHGGESVTEKQTTLAVAGGLGNIVHGSSEYYVTHDLAAIVLYALGEAQPSHYEGGVPKNLFVELG